MKTVSSRSVFLIAFTALVVLSAATSARAERLVDYVNPMIGTGGEGFGVGSAYPGPTMPFGMVKPGPDTTNAGAAPGFYHCSGYRYEDSQIRGFSHTRMHGTGIPDYGNILLMPAIGKPEDMMLEKNYRSAYSHADEQARVGYYAVTLKNTGVRVELTAGEYVAHHRYAFPATDQALIVVNASHFIGEGTPVETDVRVDPRAGEVTGWFKYSGPFSGRVNGIKTYFVIQLKDGFSSFGTWQDDAYQPGREAAHAVRAGAVLGLNPRAGKPVEVKVAISFISVEQARANMKFDVPGWDFDALRARAESAFEKLLSRIRVEGGTPTERRTFYTALYHCLIMPTLYTEAGGLYIGFDKKIHKAEGFRYYSDFSMWDTFRTFHPMLVILAPEYARDMMISLLKMYEQGGYIPKWPLGVGYTNCMSGTPADIVITDTWLKGVRDFDIELAYKGLRETATAPTPPGAPYGGRGGIEDYLKLGYLPADRHGASTAQTLEYASMDYALSRLADALGKKDDAAMFLARSQNYRNVWSSATQFFDARNADGTFPKPGSDISWRDNFEEGDAWQWLWSVQHDVPGLIQLFGGRAPYLKKLDEFFIKAHRFPSTLMPDKWYWPGNEPDIHAPYLFVWAGRPDRTQEEVRWVMRKKFPDKPSGIPGNDDGGTMSAWLAFSAMGIFPFPATNRYVIGSPIFTKVTLDYNGKHFTIKAPAASDKNLYVKSASLNGNPLLTPFLDHESLRDGATLNLDMGDTPGPWGVTKE